MCVNYMWRSTICTILISFRIKGHELGKNVYKILLSRCYNIRDLLSVKLWTTRQQ